jgi:hypothetical protein
MDVAIVPSRGSKIPFRLEGPRVPLMLGDVPPLLEHLESNQLGEGSLIIRPRVTALPQLFCSCPFSFPIPHLPVRFSLSLVLLSTLPSFLVFLSVSFYLLHLAPAEETAGTVPFSSKFQRDSSYIPSGLSGCEPWPMPEKFRSFLSSFLFTA